MQRDTPFQRYPQLQGLNYPMWLLRSGDALVRDAGKLRPEPWSLVPDKAALMDIKRHLTSTKRVWEAG
jgi:hypothetical protein